MQPPSTISAWQVYFVSNCQQSRPPKDKLVLIACIENGKPMGFFINSKIPKFIQKDPSLLICDAKALDSECAFLRRDSWIACNEIHHFPSSTLKQYRGILPKQTKQNVLASVQGCRLLSLRYKNLILNS